MSLKPLEVTTSKIATNAVTTSKLADNAVAVEKIKDGAVKTAKIGDKQVTGDKIAERSISTGKVIDGAITGIKIADGTITKDKISDGVLGRPLTPPIASVEIADGAVTSSKLQGSSVTTDKIQDGAVTGRKIAANTITQNKIAANAVGTSEIKDGAVTPEKLSFVPGGAGNRYVPRAVATWDKTRMNFEFDGVLHTDGMDLSAIVPAEAIAVHLIIEVSGPQGEAFQIYANQGTKICNSFIGFIQGMGGGMGRVHCVIYNDPDRLFDYLLTPGIGDVAVAGWYI